MGNKNLAWTSAKTAPKRLFQFYVSFGAAATKIPVWTIKTATKPKANVSAIEHSFLNHTFKYPGRVTWDNITLTLVDPIDEQTSVTVLNALTESGYQNPAADAGSMHGEGKTISKAKAVAAISDVLLVQTDSEGKVKEKWKLVNPWIVSADFGGTLDYTSDELNEITIELAFDWAERTNS